ncbi:MAG: hydrogenase formation protein HypD [Candidatus Omnitrophica bacterium]|nr:hydrogenase formation protein HypD [Candidatus Omnitrophota bacterium]
MLKFVDEYRDTDICLEMAEKIRRLAEKQVNIMEVCGGHTMSIRRNGIHKMVGDRVRLVSGPGCPVCVTPTPDIDKAIAIAALPGVAVCTYGDMMYVPGSRTSLAGARTEGADVRMVYSPQDVIEFAGNEPGTEFVFLSIGFETTAPTAAAAIVEAQRKNIANFSVMALNKTMPQALETVLSDDNCEIDGLLCPGHVSTITGTGMYERIVERTGVSCCVSGFEPADILRAIFSIVEMHEKGERAVMNAYERVVRKEGNPRARYIMSEVFDPCDSRWRGLGVISRSGLAINEQYSNMDAEKRFYVEVPEQREDPVCICGDILRGAGEPGQCPLFGTICTPENPKGACMVSSEGTCAAWYRYGG